MQLLDTKEVATRLRVSRSWVYCAIRNGELPVVKFGQRADRSAIRVDEGDLEAFVDRYRQ